jgi:hypothetical protein
MMSNHDEVACVNQRHINEKARNMTIVNREYMEPPIGLSSLTRDMQYNRFHSNGHFQISLTRIHHDAINPPLPRRIMVLGGRDW